MAVKTKQNLLLEIQTRSLEELIKNKYLELKRAQMSIIDCLNQLKKIDFKEEELY